jgi:uncharacterized protein YjiK
MKHMRKQILSCLGFCITMAFAATACVADETVVDTTTSLHLEDYQLVSGPTVIEGVAGNASGVIVDKERDALWVVMNDPTKLIELDRSTLALRRTVVLAGFDDTEDIAQLTSTKFAVTEERKQNIVIFSLTNNATVVKRVKSKVYSIDKVNSPNLGLEGLAFDAAERRFFAVKEKTPEVIYQMNLVKDQDPVISQPWDLETRNFGCTDFSAVYYHPKTKHLILLSDESKALVEVTTNGEEISRLSLKEGKAGIVERPPQPEGVTMDENDRLYVCSEPNLLYIFERRSDTQP